MLRRFGLEFARRRNKRHQRQMNVHHVLAPEVPSEFPDRFEERQALDIADRAANFDDTKVGILGRQQNPLLDLVGDVRNHLHRRTEVIAAPLLLDDRVVNLAGRAVITLAHPRLHEAFVMAQIEVGLGTVVSDENLAML